MVALLLAASFLRPGPAAAHALLLASYPADRSITPVAPGGVHLFFSGPVDPVGQGLLVIGPDGRRIPSGPLHSGGVELWRTIVARAPGTYLVIWQAISLDTHPERGRFTFSVGVASEVPGSPGSGSASPAGLALQSLARWLHLLGYALGFGPFAFRLFVLRPLGLAGDPSLRDRLDRLISVGIVAMVVAEPLALLATTASLGGGGLWDSYLAGDALSSSFGRVLAQRLGAAFALWMLQGAWRAGAARAEWLILALGIALATADGQASHAISGGPLVPGLALNAVHVATMGVWLGGLASLLRVWKAPVLAGRRAAIAAIFGRVALRCLALLALSGAAMAVSHLAGARSLANTAYGKTLLAKLTMVGVAILMAAAARRSLNAGNVHEAGAWAWWVREALALALLVALAAVLLSLPPPR